MKIKNRKEGRTDGKVDGNKNEINEIKQKIQAAGNVIY